jgi:hypothetical protein
MAGRDRFLTGGSPSLSSEALPKEPALTMLALWRHAAGPVAPPKWPLQAVAAANVGRAATRPSLLGCSVLMYVCTSV